MKLETLDDVVTGASKHSAVPLWPQMTKFNPPAPNPKCVPHIWRYDEVRPYLLRAGELVTEKDAERRVLMLVNPAREGPYTTDTLYAGLQLIMPHETAPAHRHTAFAMRFVIEGSGGFTAVNGQRIRMARGDLILTPSWTWHDHGKDEDGPMIWLDALDLPLFQFFPVHFVEHFEEKRYPAKDVDKGECELVFEWAKMKEALDRDGEGRDWVGTEYRKKDGSHVSKTLRPSAERIAAGKSSQKRRETTSCVYHVVSGRGRSVVGDKVMTWKTGDTFCVPSWNRYQHSATEDETVYLYRFDDWPMIEALGFYRLEGTDVETLVV